MKKIYGVRCVLDIYDHIYEETFHGVVCRAIAAFPDEEKANEFITTFDFSKYFQKGEKQDYPDEAYWAFDSEAGHKTIYDVRDDCGFRKVLIDSIKAYELDGRECWDFDVESAYELTVEEIPYYDI